MWWLGLGVMVGSPVFQYLALRVGNLTQVQPVADRAFAQGDYTASLQALAALRGPVDSSIKLTIQVHGGVA